MNLSELGSTVLVGALPRAAASGGLFCPVSLVADEEKSAQVPDSIVSFNHLRHAFASHWVLDGGDIFRLSKILITERLPLVSRGPRVEGRGIEALSFVRRPKLDKVRQERRLIVMSANDARATMGNSERLTWSEICRRYPDEWVVFVDADWMDETDFEFISATVLAHHKRRKDASPDVKAARAQDREVGCFWTGELRGPLPRFIP